MNIAVVSVNKQGDDIGERICELLPVTIYSKSYEKEKQQVERSHWVTPRPFHIKEITQRLMKSYDALLFITSTGIAVRAIAPFLRGKAEDPAVLVIDSLGKFVISLVSGHLGGANELTLKIAEVLKAQPIITTATDSMGLVAPDTLAKAQGLLIEDLKKAKDIAALLVGGKPVGFIDERNEIPLPKGYTDNVRTAKGLVYVTNKKNFVVEEFREERAQLKLIRRNLILGIGCKKEYDSEEMRNKVERILEENNYEIRAVKTITTVDIKKEEKAVLDLVAFLGCELKIFSTSEIEKVQYKYAGSDFVQKTIGVRAVAEPCTELAGGILRTGRLNLEGMTLCIGELEEVEEENL